jgi:hypothetical protein
MNGISDSTGTRDENPVPPYRASASLSAAGKASKKHQLDSDSADSAKPDFKEEEE